MCMYIEGEGTCLVEVANNIQAFKMSKCHAKYFRV